MPDAQEPFYSTRPPGRFGGASAMIASTAFHLVLLLLAAYWASPPPPGSAEVVDRPVGVAVVHRMPDRDRYAVPQDSPTESASESAESTASKASSPPPTAPPPIDLAGVLAAMTGPVTSGPSPNGDGLDQAGESLDAASTGGNSGSAMQQNAGDDDGSTMVFGISGSGSRFVYVFDRSDSMNGFGGRPLRAAKAELLRSLAMLTDRQRFSIIFYNDQPTPFSAASIPSALLPGDKSSIVAAKRYVNGIQAYGGTHHGSAINLALRLAPDVIFFLTDANVPRLSQTQLREIRSMASSNGTAIHAIEFGSEPDAAADSFLKELATQNRGQYRYLNVQNLP